MKNGSIGDTFLHFPLTKIIIGITVVSGTYLSAGNVQNYFFTESSLPNEVKNLIISSISTILSMYAYMYLYKWYEKRKITELYTKTIFKYLLAGFLLGTALQSLTILVMYIQGGYAILSVNPFYFILQPLAMSFSSAIFEEILIRGIVFRIMEQKLGSGISIIVSALLFGMLHLLNPNSSVATGIGLAIQAGVLLAAAYIYSRTLWFPIAIHFAWNFTQSAVFGAPVSGITLSKTLICSKITGETWFTGGTFGPEGSIQATVFCLISAISLLYLSGKKERFIQPYWKI